MKRIWNQIDLHGLRSGLLAALIVLLGIYLGSNQGRRFDPALLLYASASVFAAFGVVYRYAVWLQKPPTRIYWQRGWQLFMRPSRLPANLAMAARLFWQSFVSQTFIGKRNHARWIAHFLVSWGCLAACAITFPLVFGWVEMEADPAHPSIYHTTFLGLPAGTLESTSWIGWLAFHALDFCALAILGGMVFAMRRRMRDPGAQSVQQFANDHAPLILLFAVSVTGLMLTVSVTWMKGHSYSFIAMLHAFSVVITLLYLPFGKFFHIFQRPANLGVQFYKQEGQCGPQAACGRCREPFASAMHIADLKGVLANLGLSPFTESGHYQDICPECRRKLLAIHQLEAIGGERFIS